MAANLVPPFLRDLWPPRPWPVLAAGLVVTLLGLISSELGQAFAGARFVLFLIGLITVGVAVRLRFKTAGQAFEERMETAGVLAAAAFAALLAFLGSDKAWDSLQMLLVVLVIVALVGVVLVLLPTPARMIVGGVLIVVHFGGMVTAATSINPPGADAPWVAEMLWVHFYHPYLQFMYLNNAYHFYSPEPGPPSLVWFHIRYQNNKVKWYKVPHRDEDPCPIHHTRLLSITESTSLLAGPPQDFQLWSQIQNDRVQAGEVYGIPVEEKNYIAIPLAQQYQAPTEYSQRMIESYVRHVANEFPYLGDPDNTVKSIKVYRFRQNIINPEPMAEHRDPNDPSLFIGYYQGEFDKEGNLLYTKDEVDATGKQTAWKDRFLYWYMPIYYRPKGDDADRPPITNAMTFADMEQPPLDYLTRHAHLDLSVYPPVVRDDPDDSPWDDGSEKPR